MAIDYKSFDWRGENSYTKFGAFIMNDGDDLKFVGTPAFNNEFAQTQFGDRSFYLGTSVQNKELRFTVFVTGETGEGITLSDYRKFLSWIGVNEVSELGFSYSDGYLYKAKLGEIGEGTFYVVKQDTTDLYWVELELAFTTVNDWAARKLVVTTPQAPVMGADYEIVVQDLPSYLIIEFNKASTNSWIKITSENQTIQEYKIGNSVIQGDTVVLHTEFQMLLDSNKKIISMSTIEYKELRPGIYDIETSPDITITKITEVKRRFI